MEIIFDLESTSKYFHKTKKVHCLCFSTTEDTTIYGYTEKELKYMDNSNVLSQADLLIGHNIIGYDIPVLEKHFTNWKHTNNIFDTFIASNLMFPDLYLLDTKRKWGTLEPKLMGKHSLKAWGYRLGILKGDFGETTDWQEYSPEMLEYCKQDVAVTKALYEYLQENIDLLPIDAFNMEQQFQYCVTQQEKHGILVDTKKAQEIIEFLEPKRDKLLDDLQVLFPEKIIDKGEFIPKVNSNKLGYRVGCPLTKIVFEKFNPHSPMQVISRLKALGWQPTHFTESENPSVKEEHLRLFKNDSVVSLVEYKQVNNVLTKIRGGENKNEKSWLENIDEDGRLRHSIYQFGTNTRRCSHSPNVTQLQDNEYLEYVKPREIVIVPRGKVLVGADASALEARCLAHVINSPLFTKDILEKDIHTVNQELAGLETRAQAKTFYYGFLYGAGNSKIGSIINGTAKDGERLKNKYYSALPELKILIDKLTKDVREHGAITSIDGVKVPVPKDKSYIALNYLLQGAGAIVMKQAYIRLYQSIQGLNAKIIMFNHDEFQIECDAEVGLIVGDLAVEAIKNAGEILRFNCPLDGAYKIGKSWMETH